MMMDCSASVASAQISVARSEAAPSVAYSEGGNRRMESQSRRRRLKKSMSVASLEKDEGKPERQRRPRVSSSSRRTNLKKSISMSAMKSSSMTDQSQQRLLRKSQSRRHLQTTPNNSDRGRRSSEQKRSNRRPSDVPSVHSNPQRRRSSSAKRRSRSKSAARRKSGGKRTSTANTSTLSSDRADGTPSRKRSSKSEKSSLKASQHSNNNNAMTASRTPSRTRDSSRRTSSSRRPSDDSAGGGDSRRTSSSRRPLDDSGGDSRRTSSSRRRTSDEGETNIRSSNHRPRSGSAGPRRKPKRTSKQSRHSTPGTNDVHMSASENVHRTRASPRNSNTMHQSLSDINTVDLQQQHSRPPSRRDKLAKRKSVRAGKTMDESGQRRRRPSRAIQEHDLLQMSVSELNQNGVQLLQVTPTDPLTLSPECSSSTDPRKIYDLGVLSPAHLDKQPLSSTTCTPSQQPQEIVKVQFVQSGGKVVPLKSPATTPDPSSSTMGATPRKTKKKLSHLLGFGTTHKHSAKPSKKSPTPFSKYQTFSDDDPGKEENDNSADEPLSSWDQVDAAIPILQL